jgi:uncharacterized protein (TIGR01244 family)
MKLRLLVVVTVALFCGAIFAEEMPKALKADLDAVVSSGAVEAVDGITAAGQPDEAALKVFADQGYTTVIDLRTVGEDRGMDESAVVESLGMDYVLLPIGRDAITFDSAKTLDELIKDAEGPVLVHCGSSNRVGALLALRKSLAGADDETALAYGLDGGLSSLEGRVKDILGEEKP